jgi:Zonular occludens toxin (Zot)
MIEIIEGFGVGAGKSYYTVTRLLEHWKRGGTAYVVDTMAIEWEECKRYVERKWGYLLEDSQYHAVGEDQVLRLHEHTPPGTEDCPVVIVIDECHTKLNARDWADKSKRDLFDWCTQSRHDCNDLWFVSQSVNNIDKQVRRLATFIWRVRNTANWGKNIITGFLKMVKVFTFGWHTGAFFVVTQLDQDGKTRVGRKEWLDQEREIFACYKSRAMSGRRKRGGAAVSRLKLAKRECRRPWARWAIAAIVLILGITGCSKVVGKFRGHSSADESKSKSAEKKDAPKPAYDVRPEKFVRQLAPGMLLTDKFGYSVGEMSPDGLVEAIHGGTVRILKSNGGILYVVANGDGNAAIISSSNAFNEASLREKPRAEWITEPAPASLTISAR